MKKENKKAYLVGGGIASLAAAVYLIKDGKFNGKNIFIFESSPDIGGGLHSSSDGKKRFFSMGERMFTKEVYNCTLDLMSAIPLNKNSKKTLLDDFMEFNNEKEARWNAKARLIENGKIVDKLDFGLSPVDELAIVKMFSMPEFALEGKKISDIYPASFFKTNFWLMFCTTFAFQPWHSAVEVRRYALRFIQELPRIYTMACVVNTRHNQYDSMVLPIINWLREEGVNFITGERVVSFKFASAGAGKKRVDKIIVVAKNGERDVAVSAEDLVFFTNGSMVTNMSFGDMKTPAVFNADDSGSSWAIWKAMAKSNLAFGRPEAFCGKTDQTKWMSFSVTFEGKKFLELVEKFSKNKTGTGGIITFKDSNWFMSLIVPHQPHFSDQPENISFAWGYALSPDKKGNYVSKKMSECNGEEILTELCSHLGLAEELPEIIKSAQDCIPCMMPFITTQFMPRKKGDRPPVLPKEISNFAFIGQYCEIPDEVVFTVEQSVRSAIIAVYGLLGIAKPIQPIYQGQYDPKVIKELIKTGFDFQLKSLMTRIVEEIAKFSK